MAVALIAVGIVVTSGGGGKEEPKLDTTTSVQLERGELFVESVVPFDAIPSNFPAEASDAAMALLEAYVQEATIEPLRTGTIKDTALPEIFDGPAVARLATLDRAVLLDEGLPKAVGKVTVEGTPIGLTALLDDRKNAVLITASIDIEITAESKKGLMTVSRIGALVLSRQLDATWKITAWSLHVDRSGPGVTPTPTEPTTTTVAA